MRVSHSRRKDQVVDDPQSVAKPEGQFAVVEPAVGRPQLAEYTSTQVQNPGSKKCCVLAILLSDLPQKRPHSNNNTTFSSSSHLSIQPDNYRNNKMQQQMPEYQLFCLLENDKEPFDIYVRADETVSYLKKTLTSQGPRKLNSLHPSDLKLWQVDMPDDEEIDSSSLTDKNALKPSQPISRYWKKEPSKGFTHVYIKILGKLIAVDPPVLLQKIRPEFALHVR